MDGDGSPVDLRPSVVQETGICVVAVDVGHFCVVRLESTRKGKSLGWRDSSISCHSELLSVNTKVQSCAVALWRFVALRKNVKDNIKSFVAPAPRVGRSAGVCSSYTKVPCKHSDNIKLQSRSAKNCDDALSH